MISAADMESPWSKHDISDIDCPLGLQQLQCLVHVSNVVLEPIRLDQVRCCSELCFSVVKSKLNCLSCPLSNQYYYESLTNESSSILLYSSNFKLVMILHTKLVMISHSWLLQGLMSLVHACSVLLELIRLDQVRFSGDKSLMHFPMYFDALSYVFVILCKQFFY
jgi:hypothetical protein